MTAELIERLERGETGWPINGEIYLALFPDEGYHFQPHKDKVRVEGWLVDRSHGEGFQGYNRKIRVEPYTTSLDAAIALVERVAGRERMKEIYLAALDKWFATEPLDWRKFAGLLVAALLKAEAK